MLSRRDLLLGGACAPLLSFSSTSTRSTISRLHAADILDKAKRLAAGRDARLRLLIPEGSATNITENLRFFERHTGVKMSLREVPVDEVSTRLILESATGHPSFDIALPATFGLPDLAESGALLPLDDLAVQHEPAGLQAGDLYRLGDRYKGRFYGYQADGDVYLMFYNQRIAGQESLAKGYADTHGKELRVPQTWEELDQQMQYLHAPEEGRFGGCLFRTLGYLEWEWWIRLHAKGVLPFDEEMHPLFDGEAGVQALEELVAASAWQTPNAASQGLFDNWKEYGHGAAYANIGWGGTQKFLRSSTDLGDSLSYGPTPGGMAQGRLLPTSYFNWGWNYIVSAHSPEPEVAYLFTLYASLPERSTIAVRADGFFDPHRTDHYSDKHITAVYSEEFLAQHKASMQNCIPDLYLQGRGEYFAKLGRFLDRANRGELTSERALQLAARSWDQITDRLGRSGQVEQWTLLRESYPQHVLEAQPD